MNMYTHTYIYVSFMNICVFHEVGYALLSIHRLANKIPSSINTGHER